MDLGAPPLNVQPQGLLSFLQVKSGGRYPQALGETLAPTWDLSDHYLQTNGEITLGAAAVITAGFNNNVILAAENFWRYFNWLTVHFILVNAADFAVGDLIARPQSAGNTVPGFVLPGPNSFQVTATTRQRRSYAVQGNAVANITTQITCPRFWLPPGFRLENIQENAANASTSSVGFSRSVVNLRA